MNRNNIIFNIIGLIHLLGVTGVATYSSAFSKSKYDMYVLLSIFAIIISWTIHNGECFVSQYVKHYTNTEDMLFLFDGNRKSLELFSSFIIIMYLVSIWQLLVRNNYSIYLCIWLSIVYIVYIFAVQLMRKKSSNHCFAIIQGITNITFIAFGSYIIYRLFIVT